MYFSFLEVRSVTSKYAAAIGGVTSEEKKLFYLCCLTSIFIVPVLTFGVDLFQGHLVGRKGSDHLVGWEQTDTVFPLRRAASNSTSKEQVSPAFSSLHRLQVSRPPEAVHLVRRLRERKTRKKVSAFTGIRTRDQHLWGQKGNCILKNIKSVA